MTPIEAEGAMEQARWSRVTCIFDRLLDGVDVADAIWSEPDVDIREAALDLWRHHLNAVNEDFLSSPLEFEVTPMFQPRQILVNRFRIERMLGSGGMGEVYLAWQEGVDSPVALKTIARLLAPSEAIRKRFLAEVRNARRVTHPNVCRIHELFAEGETAFFSMEYVEGIPLSEAAGSLTPRQCLTVAKDMAEALCAAHRKGVIHGDFKPANVMMVGGAESEGLHPMIMDFGLARVVDSAGGSNFAGLSLRAGACEYMAPELLKGEAPSIRSDIFAFGKVGRELLPRERIWDECTRLLPEDRPDSLQQSAGASRSVKIAETLADRPRDRGGRSGGICGVASRRIRDQDACELSDRLVVALTADGRELLDRYRERVTALEARMLAGLAKTEISGLRQHLHACQANLALDRPTGVRRQALLLLVAALRVAAANTAGMLPGPWEGGGKFRPARPSLRLSAKPSGRPPSPGGPPGPPRRPAPPGTCVPGRRARSPLPAAGRRCGPASSCPSCRGRRTWPPAGPWRSCRAACRAVPPLNIARICFWPS